MSWKAQFPTVSPNYQTLKSCIYFPFLNSWGREFNKLLRKLQFNCLSGRIPESLGKLTNLKKLLVISFIL